MPTLQEISSFREEIAEKPEAVETLETAVEEAEEVVEEVIAAEEETPTEEEAVEYFNDLPDAMGWAPEDFYKLKLKTDAGEVFTWSEIKDNLQQAKTQREELAAKEDQLRSKEQEVYQTLARTQQQTGPVSEAVQTAQANVNAIAQAYQQTIANMQALEQDDDTAGLVKAQSELLRLQGLHAQAQQQLQGAAQQQQQLNQQNFAQYRQSQAQQLASKLPVFREPETRKTAISELRSYLGEQGYNENEISTIADARAVAMAYKAMMHDKHQTDVKKTSQAIRDGTVKRIIKGKHVKTQPTRERLDRTIERAKSSRRESDKRAAFRAIAEDAGILNLGNS